MSAKHWRQKSPSLEIKPILAGGTTSEADIAAKSPWEIGENSYLRPPRSATAKSFGFWRRATASESAERWVSLTETVNNALSRIKEKLKVTPTADLDPHAPAISLGPLADLRGFNQGVIPDRTRSAKIRYKEFFPKHRSRA